MSVLNLDSLRWFGTGGGVVVRRARKRCPMLEFKPWRKAGPIAVIQLMHCRLFVLSERCQRPHTLAQPTLSRTRSFCRPLSIPSANFRHHDSITVAMQGPRNEAAAHRPGSLRQLRPNLRCSIHLFIPDRLSVTRHIAIQADSPFA